MSVGDGNCGSNHLVRSSGVRGYDKLPRVLRDVFKAAAFDFDCDGTLKRVAAFERRAKRAMSAREQQRAAKMLTDEHAATLSAWCYETYGADHPQAGVCP